MNKWALVFGLAVSSAVSAQAWQPEYLAACDFSKYSEYFYIQQIMTPKEWLDLSTGKGQQEHENWLGPYKVYESKDLKIIYTGKFDPQFTPLAVVFGKSRVPESVATKEKVAALFNVKSNMTYSSNYSTGCDCHEVEFNFAGSQTTQVEINYAPCI